MLTCERCETRFSGRVTSDEVCPRCLLKEHLAVPLIVAAPNRGRFAVSPGARPSIPAAAIGQRPGRPPSQQQPSASGAKFV